MSVLKRESSEIFWVNVFHYCRQFIVTDNGQEFPLKPNMVEIKRYKKKVHGKKMFLCVFA